MKLPPGWDETLASLPHDQADALRGRLLASLGTRPAHTGVSVLPPTKPVTASPPPPPKSSLASQPVPTPRHYTALAKSLLDDGKRQAAFLELQREHLPGRERILCGWPAIRDWL